MFFSVALNPAEPSVVVVLPIFRIAAGTGKFRFRLIFTVIQPIILVPIVSAP